jgi:hypothetical protein
VKILDRREIQNAVPITRVVMVARRTAPDPGRKHAYLYDALLDGEIIVANTPDPECALARALLARSVT